MTPEEMKKMLEELKQLWEQFKGKHTEIETEVKKHGTARAEDQVMLKKISDRIDEIETKLSRPVAGALTKTDEQHAQSMERRKAFVDLMRKGDLPAERKSLIVSDDTQGGFLAPSEFVGEIIKGQQLYSPIRKYAYVRQTSARSVQMPKRTGVFAAQWVAEQGTRTETTGLKIGLEEIPNHEMYALVKVSLQDLEDTSFNLEEYIAMEAAEQFGIAEGTGFVSGNGVGKPEGLLTPTIGENVSGSASTLADSDGQINGLIALSYALKEPYVPNASWLMKRATMGAIRMLKDGNHNYIWTPPITAGEPSILLGSPVVEATDMPAVAANAYPVIFGDLRRAYMIVDRLEMVTIRDPLTSKAQGLVEFMFRKRVGGQVVLPEAIRKLKIST